MSASSFDAARILADSEEWYKTPRTADTLTSNPYIHADTDVSSLTSLPCPYEHPLRLTIHQTQQSARAATLDLPHGAVQTPVFMPVGTRATIKGLTQAQLDTLNEEIILANTYHLALQPTADVVAALGGIHRFMNWKHNILTDSGGFQMVSLLALAHITESGVTFKSPIDNSPMHLSPEKSIHIQNCIGSDIMMMLDDVCAAVTIDPNRIEEATHRTIRWLDRCIMAHSRPTQQNLFAIVQGGLDLNKRSFCTNALMERDAWLSGYAIGGLSGGEDKNTFWRVVHHCCQLLPKHKPRYCMGVGYPVDMVVCVCLGVDMFDCVWPCRTARFGTAITSAGLIHLRRAQYNTDDKPLDTQCTCFVCKTYTRSFLSSIATKTPTGCHLITYHNLFYLKNLMFNMRQAILQENLSNWLHDFFKGWYPEGNGFVPKWVHDAFEAVNLSVGQWGADHKEAEIILSAAKKEKEQKIQLQNNKKKVQTAFHNNNKDNRINADFDAEEKVNDDMVTNDTSATHDDDTTETHDVVDKYDNDVSIDGDEQQHNAAVIGKRKDHPTPEVK